jgi:type IV pilus assembly protein PilW
VAKNNKNGKRGIRGFSLVEVMVAMVIGMLAMIVMMQVFATFEGQKRTTASGSEAQNTGALTLDLLRREIGMAGYGISSSKLVACDLTLPSGLTIKDLGPVTINANPNVVANGDAQTDTLLVFYGTSNSPTEGDSITAQPASSTYAVSTPTSFAAGDQVIAATNVALPQPNPCVLAMTSVQSSGGSATPFNANVTVASGVAGVNNGLLFNLGAKPVVHAYAVRNGNLTMCDYMVSDCGDKTQTGNPQVWMEVARDVVSLRAQYGADNTQPAMDGTVDMYRQNTPQTTCAWMRTLSIRLGLAVRSGQLEKKTVTPGPPAWAGGPSAGASAVQPAGSGYSPFNLNGNPSWQKYRYKVYEATVPLRNMTWAVDTGC